MPLWALCNGYKEYLESQIKYGDILVEGKVLIRCPYTSPPLVDKNDPTAGFVVYNENFGKGKWIDGGGLHPPTREEQVVRDAQIPDGRPP